MKELLKTYWPTALTLLVIFYATWLADPMPDTELPKIPLLDKLIHIIMMGGLTGALMFDYYRRKPHRPLTLRIIIAFTAGVMAFGIVDEVVQGLLPINRPSDPFDLLADWTGCLIGALIAPPVIRKIISGHWRPQP